jgi:hypothetical protein
MTTQNLHQRRIVFAAGVAAGTYYGPIQTGAGVAGALEWSATAANAYINMDGYDHLSIQGYVVAAGAPNAQTCTLTVRSDDGVVLAYPWDETLGCWESTTGVPAASWIGSGGVNTYFHLHLDNCGGRLFHVRIVTTDNTGAAVVTFRQTKV